MNGNDENKIEAIIDVGGKPIMRREAVATGTIYLQEKTIYAIENNQISKGDVLEASTVAVIQAVKDTPRVIPHCHIVPIEGCKVDWNFEGRNLRCTVEVSAHYRTGGPCVAFHSKRRSSSKCVQGAFERSSSPSPGHHHRYEEKH